MKPIELTFDKATTLPEAMRCLDGFAGELISIVETGSIRLMGIVSESAIIRTYLDAVDGLRQKENAPA